MKVNSIVSSGLGLVMVFAMAGSALAMEIKGDSAMTDKTGDTMMMHLDANLGSGARGAGVSALQEVLISKGFLTLPAGVVKGTFGPATKRALMRYQTSLGVPASGFFGAMTRAHMSAMMKGGDAMKKDEAMMKQDTGGAVMKKDEAMMKKDGAMMKHDDAMMAHNGSYIPYSADKLALAAKGPVVLFFRAGWCPICRGIDADIKAHLKDIPENVTILDVDYDNSTDLKVRYGVTYQHTFVQVDAQGTLIKKWSGSFCPARYPYQ